MLLLAPSNRCTISAQSHQRACLIHAPGIVMVASKAVIKAGNHHKLKRCGWMVEMSMSCNASESRSVKVP